jgi:hypothetical protein
MDFPEELADDYDSLEQAHAYYEIDSLRELLDEGKSLRYVMRYKAQVLRECKKIYEYDPECCEYDPKCWDKFVSHFEGAFSRLIKQYKATGA